MAIPPLRVTLHLFAVFLLSSAQARPVTYGAAQNAFTGATLDDSDPVTAPRMFQNFCSVRPDQCITHGQGDVSQLSDLALAELRGVNQNVNHRIRPLPAPATDAYQLGVTAGSCNEYAVEKRRELLTRGWSAAALSLTVVRLADSRGHLLLTVRTDRGDLVLDNLTDRIVSVDQADYAWVERQSTIHPMLWVRIAGVAAPTASFVSAKTVAADESDDLH